MYVVGTDSLRPFFPFFFPFFFFQVDKMLSESLVEDHYGPIIPFREYSFLDNPRLPAAVSTVLCSTVEYYTVWYGSHL